MSLGVARTHLDFGHYFPRYRLGMCECLSYIVDGSSGSAFGWDTVVVYSREWEPILSAMSHYNTMGNSPLSSQLLAPFIRSLPSQHLLDEPNHLFPILHTLTVGRESLVF